MRADTELCFFNKPKEIKCFLFLLPVKLCTMKQLGKFRTCEVHDLTDIPHCGRIWQLPNFLTLTQQTLCSLRLSTSWLFLLCLYFSHIILFSSPRSTELHAFVCWTTGAKDYFYLAWRFFFLFLLHPLDLRLINEVPISSPPSPFLFFRMTENLHRPFSICFALFFGGVIW